MRIGFLSKDYPEERCILHKITSGSVEYVNLKRWLFDFPYIVDVFRRKIIGGKINFDTLYFYNPIYVPRVDIIHTFNHVCNVQGRWVVTFESAMPRTKVSSGNEWKLCCLNGERFKLSEFEIKSLELLQRENCMKIIALSESTYRLQNFWLDSLDTCERVDVEAIKNKMIVVHPPQKVLISEEGIHEKFDKLDCIRFLFVGNDFFRKGGAELVDVLMEYQSKGANISLTVVSKLQYGDYATGATVEEYNKYKEILSSNKWITWYVGLPNNEVLELAKQSHIGCLPTFSDTYGYSVLELQACGCPCITTDIRSLPEINNNQCGWICHLRQNDIFGGAICTTLNERLQMRAILKEELRQCLGDLLKKPELIEEKAFSSVKRIADEHDPIQYAAKMIAIYNNDM